MWGKTFSMKSVFPYTPFPKVLSTGGGGNRENTLILSANFVYVLKISIHKITIWSLFLLRRITVRCLFPLYEVALLRLFLQQQIAHLWLFLLHKIALTRLFMPPHPSHRATFSPRAKAFTYTYFRLCFKLSYTTHNYANHYLKPSHVGGRWQDIVLSDEGKRNK